MKFITALFILILTICSSVRAQKRTQQDTADVVDAAHRYARGFILRKKYFEQFKKRHFLPTSDYFKPNVSLPDVLLRDSVFVKTYRIYAFANTLDRSTDGRFPPLFPSRPSPFDSDMQDYNNPFRNLARKDVKRFILPDNLLIKLKAGQIAETSDFFKPAITIASDPALLADSTYTKEFRQQAFDRSIDRRISKSK